MAESGGEVSTSSEAEIPAKWTNRERVLIFCSRGTSFRDRHLMIDLISLMPHARTESKMDKKDKISSINEICEMKNCRKCIYFESRKKKDLYMWLANVPRGPTAKFLVQNVHTMLELKLTGNCLKGSRPLLSFDAHFSDQPFLMLLKEMFTQTFSVPNNHPRSKPFVDHILSFSIYDDRIWIRNYQVVNPTDGVLEEIGPRMTLNLITIQGGSFGGPLLFKNPNYVSPNLIRRQIRAASSGKYLNKVMNKLAHEKSRQEQPVSFKTDPLDDIFQQDVNELKNSAAGKNVKKSDAGKQFAQVKKFQKVIDRKRRKKNRGRAHKASKLTADNVSPKVEDL
ncbi:ribosome biogenesis protein BRX1 [Trichuris trichiura]|uniref:Ribosome biogenesis protein BRX1 homolog n=1 Tax=Trichuris trichiura TaxID=36087 RepID=A0A077ZDI7_TRITR|nr:ribosome biogenesis protein BRX1 [Trichuris trichiura]